MKSRHRELGIVILFLLGSGIGTALALFFQQQFQSKIQIYQPFFKQQLDSLTADVWDFFLYILRARFWELAACMLISMTVIAYPAFCLLSLYGGFCMAGMIVTATAANGIMGLPVFLASIMPHYLFYVAGIFLLMFQSCCRQGLPANYAVQSYLFIGTIFLIGVGLETWCNPFLLRLVL